MEAQDRALTPRKQPLLTTSPDSDRQVAGLIARLLLHFWAPSDLPEAARKAMAQDWLDDLREFGPEIVAAACTQYRRQPGQKRPTPGDIRAICADEQFARSERLALQPPIELTEEQIQQAADAYARDHNFTCIEAMQRAGHTVVVRTGPGKFRRFEGLLPTLPAETRVPVGGFSGLGVTAQRVTRSMRR